MNTEPQSGGEQVEEVRGNVAQPASATLTALLVAALIAWVGHPSALVEWLSGFPVHPVIEWSITQADSLALWTESTGLDEVHRRIRSWVGQLREL